MKFERHLPIGPWEHCVHELAVFDNFQEFRAALALDRSTGLSWWVRNDPPILKIPTPMGGFEPDFFYRRTETAGSGERSIMGILEVKGDFLWRSEESPDRIKAAAAKKWVERANASGDGDRWEFLVLLDQDALEAVDFMDMRTKSVLYVPPPNTL